MSTKNVQFSIAVHILASLGYHEGAEVRSAELAESINAEPTFVRRTLSRLTKAGLVSATRGRNGACRLGRAPESITLLDIYRASEAPPTSCMHTYPVESRCLISVNIKDCMQSVLEDAQRGFEARLAEKTLDCLLHALKSCPSKDVVAMAFETDKLSASAIHPAKKDRVERTPKRRRKASASALDVI
ncbi:RrF2 family transcriptional regulator [Robbsia andropogonis]|uniref:RrF2 family transcriptional regulator n=1 Tax=Robbsia andropogonis TaxID=28092 RepID=UPI0004678E1A|nr:Rrf2 family transcriptional regulator [Robbsia andropogonis]MCP1118550.1 Rrf2 family transcriptional regulator [Robbsia andropogonis]MCP1128017.1 Rrf2 family transcriptional regulator [Robbsia andropogonis]